jgi:predicted nucleic acid-binding protein
MILADTSVWIDHFRIGNERLAQLLDAGGVLMHPAVMGELVLGGLGNRGDVLRHLRALPTSRVSNHEETMIFILNRGVAGSGVGYVDASLLASVALSPGATFWTSDRKAHALSSRLGLAAPL